MLKLLFSLLVVCTSTIGLGQLTLTGIVKDESSKPLADIAIRLLNTNLWAYSDSDGVFTFRNLPKGNYTIYVSAAGFAEIDKTVSLNESTKAIELLLGRTNNKLETVIVSSQKKEETLQRIPASIRAFSSQDVEEYRLWNIADLSGIVPNLYSTHPGDNRNVTSIRGIVNTSYDPAVVTYIDGVNQFNLDTYIPQLFDIERIEVLKGPQGTLYGRNAMGGAINIITKKPGNQTNGFIQLSGGNYAQRRITGGLRFPLVRNKLFFGAAGLYEATDGFYSNEFNNQPYDKRSNVIGNYYLRFIPNTQWAITLNAKQSFNRNRGAFPLGFGKDEAFDNPFRLNQNAVTKMIDNSFNSSLSINYFNPVFQLTSQTAFQSNHRYYTDPIDADFSPLAAISIINNYGDEWNKVKVLTQEINIQSAASNASAFNWLLGSYFFHVDNPVKQTTRFGEQAQLAGAPDNNFSLINTSKAKSNGIAFYGQMNYAFSEKIALTAGIRYDRERKKQNVLGEYQKDPDPNPVFAYRSDTSAIARFSAVSPKITLAFHANKNQTIYAGFSRGFRAGGLTPLSQDPSQPALYPFQPEFGNNLEAGWKQNLPNQKLVINLALFRSSIIDVQVPTLVLPDAVTITRNTGKLISTGIELEVRSLLLKGLSVEYNFGYVKTRYSRLKISQNGSEVDLQDRRQLFTPDVTSLLAAQYTHLFGNNKTSVVFRCEWKYLGAQYFDLANTIRQSPYHIINTQFGIALGKTEIMLWGRNIADQRYISYAYDFGAVHLGNPVTYGITTGIRF